MAEEADNDEREEGTEPAIPRRIQRARDDGDAPLSREAVGFATLLAASATAALTLPGQVAQFQAALRGALGRAHEWGSMAAAREWLHLFLAVVWPVPEAAILAAVAATLAQTRGVVTLRAFSFDLGRLSPLAGFKRLFGGEAWLEFGRTLLKLGGVGAARWLAALGLAEPGGLLEVPPAALFDAAGSGVPRLLASRGACSSCWRWAMCCSRITASSSACA